MNKRYEYNFDDIQIGHAKDLLIRMLQIDPKKRISAKDAL